MLTIRLQRTGKKNHSHFRVVLAEKTAHVSKKIQEVLGSYNPHTKEFIVKNAEKLQYWIDQNVSISPTAHNLLVMKGHLKADKVRAFNTPKVAPKVEEAAPAATPAAEVAVEAAPAPEAAPEVVAEAPVEANPEPTTEAPTETPAA
ncbi:MAG: ribosomal protein [Candidatus Doudnabacteria bacterium]|nr:ribosomal protein [Candidatus Doudnabacteria bacterium]